MGSMHFSAWHAASSMSRPGYSMLLCFKTINYLAKGQSMR
jgi:hypothetical protein